MGAQFFGLVSLPIAERMRGLARVIEEQIDVLEVALARSPSALRLVKTADGTLSAERVVGDSTSIVANWVTAGAVDFQRAALTGDVTASANSNATTIANGAVTAAKTSITGTPTGSKFLRDDWSWQTVTAAPSDGDKGDITVSASGATWTIDAGAVTLAKMANLTAGMLIGRQTSGDGVPQAIKDAAAAQGFPTTLGNVLLKDAVAESDGLTAARMKAVLAVHGVS